MVFSKNNSIKVKPARKLTGELTFAGDKSISHRLVLFSLVNCGQIEINNIADGIDLTSSIKAIKQLGVEVENTNGRLTLKNATGSAITGQHDIDCGNSGTTARLLAGILAGQHGSYKLFGDASLSRRPMQRIVDPLTLLNAHVEADNGFLPLKITGNQALKAALVENPTGSAQVKSAIMFAALQAKGETSIKERVSGRDHTEKLFCHLNLPINFEDAIIKVRGSCKPSGLHRFNVPGDISSAAFLVTAATIIDGSRLLIKDVCLNPTRTGFIKVLRRMGANIETTEGERVWEPRGDILVNSAKLKATEIMPDEIPHLIDELPILATAMAFAEGTSRVFGARELRHKETDRIRDLASQMSLAGIHCRELTDGFEITGPSQIKHQASLDSFGDHRLAMSFAVLALNSEQGLTIKGADSIAISFPKFFTTLHSCIQQKN